ncbi:hypothetical protein SAMN02927924_02338 [Sphingobium faniae]|nr:hypothetical protein SAMN02927924_02338 [Sphingobium faniae]
MQTSHHPAARYAAPARRPSGASRNASQLWSNELQKWEFFLLQGAVFFAPYISFRHPAIYITISDVMFAGAFCLRLATGRMMPPFANLTWLWLLGLFMLTGGLFFSTMFHGDMARCLILIAQYCFAYLVVPLVLLRRPEDQVIRLIKCGIWGMVIMCAIGIAIYMTGWYSMSRGQMAVITGSRRLAGFVDNPNAMAVLTVMTLPLVWFLLLSRQLRPSIALLCLGLLIYGVILTSSNTGLYSMIAATLIFFGGRRNFKTLLVVAALGAAALTFGQDYMPQKFQERVLGAINSGDISGAGTFEDRQELNIEALTLADDNLILGMGADQYRVVSQYGHPVHNLYLLLLNEGGGLSLLGYLVILGVPILAGIFAWRLPYGKLIFLTIFTTVIVFANAIMGVPHVYGRAWFLFIFLAVSPALISYGVVAPRWGKAAGGPMPSSRF